MPYPSHHSIPLHTNQFQNGNEKIELAVNLLNLCKVEDS